jgi:MYXO-CTERM domain-containing protein
VVKGKKRRRGNKARWRAGAAVGVLLLACDPASAFYWHGWPGSHVTPPTTIVPPTVPPVGPPVVVPPVVPPAPPVVPPPSPTPEPATALLGVVGLGALAARRILKK